MTQLHETAYPRLKADPSPQELDDIYTLRPDEIAFIDQTVKRPVARTAAFLYLKLFQRMGYFVLLKDVPASIREHIVAQTGYARPPKLAELTRFDRSSGRTALMAALRRFLDVRPLDDAGRAWLQHVAESAADTRHVVADIINVMLEELVHHRYELPGFATLDRLAIQSREKIHEAHFSGITNQLDERVKLLIDSLFKVNVGEHSSTWNLLKREPKKPTNKETRSYLQHIRRLQRLVEQLPKLDIPVPKLKQYRYIARSLDASEMQELKQQKRYALAVIYIRSQFAQTLDDAADLLVRMLNKLDNQARTKLLEHQQEHLQQTDRLVEQLKDILQAYRIDGDDHQRVEAIRSSLSADVDDLLSICDEHMAYAGRNHLPFLVQPYKAVRAQLLNCIDIINPHSSSEDDTLTRMMKVLQLLRNNRHETVPITQIGLDAERDLHWLSAAWRKLIAPEKHDGQVVAIHRRYFELAVLYAIRDELKSGDLYIPHGERYDDYREQLVDDDTLNREMVQYGIVTGVETNPEGFVKALKDDMLQTANAVDAAFPANAFAEIVDGRLILKKPPAVELLPAVRQIDQLLGERLEQISILDVLIDTERWLQLRKLFRPLMGTESRIEELRPRIISTLFCYGCNMGPSQTAKSIRGMSRKQVAWLNIKYVTEETLEQAIVKVINAYQGFELPRYWGSGKHASADGTKWNLYEQNLISERHIRYGTYGGIGYYHVSDKFIALFSHFISCGTYEGTHILDGLMANTSDIRPDTVHGDTQAQSYTVFALAHLLGIKLMPRIRGIKDLVFHRPDPSTKFQHIDRLFSDSVNWQLIETHLPDMLRVVVSIKLGKISASAILRRLGTYSRKNKLYFAFRELGKVIRTIFLLKYIGDLELRKVIQSETNKSEQFNAFAKLLFFGGGGVIAENLHHEQRKVIKYNHLVANLVILHNVVNMSKVLKQLQNEGISVSQEILAGLAPYRLQHINRYGDYVLDFRRRTEPLEEGFRILDI
jgi:TnpA family transposase